MLPDTAENLFGSIGSLFQKMNVARDQLVKLELRKKSERRIPLSFINSRVYIAISAGKNLFEPPFFKTMLSVTLIEEFFKFLYLAVGIVEELDLNTRIRTKT